MKKNIHLIMPMGGRGSRFKNMEECPKPLLRLMDKPFFYWATQSIVKHIDVTDITFVVLKEHIERFGIDIEIRNYYPNANIVVIPDVLEGAVLTCAEGVKAISDQGALIFNDCDHAFASKELDKYCRVLNGDNIQGALLSFNSTEPNYSYLRKNEKGYVIETVEKEVISEEAICGCYYFNNKTTFLNCMELYLNECSYKEYFMSGMYNVMIKQGMLVKAFPVDFHIPFGIPEEYEIAKNDKRMKELE